MKQERHFKRGQSMQAGKWVERYLEYRQDDKEYTVRIVQRRKRRSLDANAYLWVLIDELATALNMKKLDVYRQAIKDIGGVSEVVCVQEHAVEKLCKHWEKKGAGWLTETASSQIKGCKTITLYFGSSSYDTKQMSRLTDNIVQDCNAVGIETMSEQELSLLKEQWHEKAD